MKDLMGLMKQAQAMQAKMAEMQSELEQSEVQGQSGAGLVKVTLTAKGNMKAIAIDPSLLKGDEGEILEDLIVTAHEDARKKAERLMEEKMKSVDTLAAKLVQVKEDAVFRRQLVYEGSAKYMKPNLAMLELRRRGSQRPTSRRYAS